VVLKVGIASYRYNFMKTPIDWLKPLGFGEYLKYSFTGINIVNKAIGGRSARSYWNEGRFQAIADLVVSGDYVLMYGNHPSLLSIFQLINYSIANSATTMEVLSLQLTMVVQIAMEAVQRLVSLQRRERQYIPTCFTCCRLGKHLFHVLSEIHEINLESHRRLITAKGAHVVVASPTPNNLWETGTFSYTAPRFTGYARSVATSLGSLAAFVDHGQYVANRYQTLGATAVDAFYPIDHTHTSPAGANVVASTFIKGLLCGGSALSSYVKNSTSSITGSCV
jgi:rhamnogalacturonan acetylesterase